MIRALHIVTEGGRNQNICVLLPVTLPQPGLGRIAEQVQVLLV
jgi:hypothetical protein